MLLRLHLPTQLNTPDDWSPTQRLRLQRTVHRAIERAVAKLQRPDVEIEIISDSNELASVAAISATPDKLQEQLDPNRVRDAGGRYGVPSYEAGGKEVEIPVRRSAQDRVIRRAFPKSIAVLVRPNNWTLGGFSKVYAGGAPYIVTESLERALNWGKAFNRGVGFAVFQNQNGTTGTAFSVVPLVERLSVDDLGYYDASVQSKAMARVYGLFSRPDEVKDYSLVTVVTGEGVTLHRPTGQAGDWADFNRLLTQTSKSKGSVSTSDLKTTAGGLLRARRASQGKAGIRKVITQMDRTVFAAMPWEQRAEFLELLIRGWTGEAEEITILEIIHGTRSASELEAIFAILRQHGVYEQLFDDLDERVFDLLKVLGDYSPAGPLNWRYLVKVLTGAGKLKKNRIPSGPELERELEQLAGGLLDWLQSTWQGLKFLFTEFDKMAEATKHLAEFLWVVEQARWREQWAMDRMDELMRQIRGDIVKAIRGLEYAEMLGNPAGKREPDSSIGRDIVVRLQAALVLEAFTIFIGLAEIKAVLKATKLTDRLAGLPRALGSLRHLGRGTEVPENAALIARLEAKMAQSGGVTTEIMAGLETLLRHFPKEQAGLVRLLDGIPSEHMDDFMRTLSFIRPKHFKRWGMAQIEAIARRPRALIFMREAGSNLFDLAFRRTGDWPGFERFLDGLALKRSQLGDPVQYQRFLDRLRNGDTAAFDEVGEMLQPQRPLRVLPARRDWEGRIVLESEIGLPSPRSGYERQLLPAVEVDLPGWHRAHSQGAGTGLERSEAIFYAPPRVNLELQNSGIERFIRELYQQKAADVRLHLVTATQPHPGTLRLSRISYRVDAERAGRRRALFEAELTVANVRDAPKVTVTVTQRADIEEYLKPLHR